MPSDQSWLKICSSASSQGSRRAPRNPTRLILTACSGSPPPVGVTPSNTGEQPARSGLRGAGHIHRDSVVLTALLQVNTPRVPIKFRPAFGEAGRIVVRNVDVSKINPAAFFCFAEFDNQNGIRVGFLPMGTAPYLDDH